MMYLVRSASLRNIILRLRRLALRTPILPVVCNGHQPSSIGHALQAGPLSPLLNMDLRAELRFDVRRWGLNPAYLPYRSFEAWFH
jgi:hypothetical protein